MASKMKYSKQQISILAHAFKKSRLTITRWIKSKDDRLTSEKAVFSLKTSYAIVPKYFAKDYVYNISGKRHLCVLLDENIACLCPIVVHIHGGGYKTIYKASIYSATISNNGEMDILIDGYVENGRFVAGIKSN